MQTQQEHYLDTLLRSGSCEGIMVYYIFCSTLQIVLSLTSRDNPYCQILVNSICHENIVAVFSWDWFKYSKFSFSETPRLLSKTVPLILSLDLNPPYEADSLRIRVCWLVSYRLSLLQCRFLIKYLPPKRDFTVYSLAEQLLTCPIFWLSAEAYSETPFAERNSPVGKSIFGGGTR